MTQHCLLERVILFLYETWHYSENGKYYSSFGIAAMVALGISPLERNTNNVLMKSGSNYIVPTKEMTWASVVGQSLCEISQGFSETPGNISSSWTFDILWYLT